MRVLLLAGSGGAGTTTLAAATVAHAGRRGVKADLLASADLPVRVGGGQVGGGRVEGAWDELLALAAAAVGAARPADVTAPELPVPPPAGPLALLLEVRDRLRAGRHDLLVVDLPVLPEALRLLELPAVLAAWVDAVAPVEERLARALRSRGSAPSPGEVALAAVDRLRRDLDEVLAALTGQHASVRLVVRPEPGPVHAALQALPVLSLLGYRVDGLVAGRVVPPGGTDPWRTAVARAHAAEVGRLRSASAVPVHVVGWAAQPPTGARALASLGAALHGDADLAAACAVPDPVRVERAGDGFVLRLALAQARREDLGLARAGDDLVVTLGAVRRRLTLPPALRRCTVDGATLRDGELRVRLEPDPALWRTP